MDRPTSLETFQSASIPSSLIAGGLQRKCACGQHTIAGGECNACSERSESSLQRSAMSHDSGNSNANNVPPIVHDVLRSSGQPLDAATRSFMEPRFGHDFSRVRVHTDAKAAESAQAVNALAYTVGSNIVFAENRYRSGTNDGMKLLAHELTHVVQQERIASSTPMASNLQHSGSAQEQEADSVADAVLRGQSVPRVRALAGGLRLHRKPDPEKKDVCSPPTALPYTEIIKPTEVQPGTLGYTKVDAIKLGLEPNFKDGNCKVLLTGEPKFSFKYYMSVKDGTYQIGTVTATIEPCKDKEAAAYVTITPDMAKRVAEGEKEHCADDHRAFDLSYARYSAAAQELGTGFAAKDKTECDKEVLKRLADKTGVDTSKWKTVADCLFAKTLQRDAVWHKADLGNPVFSKDCKKVTLTPDPKKTLLEIANGKHPTDTLIKGCGEK